MALATRNCLQRLLRIYKNYKGVVKNVTRILNIHKIIVRTNKYAIYGRFVFFC